MTRLPFALLTGAALVCAGASIIAPASAQQPYNNGSAAASQTVPPGQVAPGQNPYTRSLNHDVQGNIDATKQDNAAAQAQYQQDLAGYDASLRTHGHHVMRQNEHYQHERRAYADAMRAWREQVWACKHGHRRACNAPAPDPASFY